MAGDSIYNEIHPMLGLSTPEEWQDWLETVDLVEELDPRMIVAGHRRPDGDDHAVDTMIAETRAYINDFAAAYEVADNAEDLIADHVGEVPRSRKPLDPAVLGHECHWASQHEKRQRQTSFGDESRADSLVGQRARNVYDDRCQQAVPKAADGAVTVEKNDDNVLLIGIDRPAKRNALTPELLTRLGEVYESYESDDALRCAVLFGHGPVFCAGADLNQLKDAVDSD